MTAATAPDPVVDHAAPRMQRARGEGRVSSKREGGRTRLDRLYQEGCAKIRMPRVLTGDALEAVLINSSGGLTGGDRLAWTVTAGTGTSTVVTTQASEKIYRSAGGAADVSVKLVVGVGARLAWLPQETILFEGAALSRSLDVALAPDASALIVEPTLFGRLAMGERLRRASFVDRWRVWCDSRLVHAEHQRFGPWIGAEIERTAVLGGASAMATLLWLHRDAEEHVERIRAVAGPVAGVSGWRVSGSPMGKVLVRLVAEDGYLLRKRLVPVIKMLNGQAGLPRAWSL
ncbi:MAG: urease accessory protein UreD [Pararhizobium sp.]